MCFGVCVGLLSARAVSEYVQRDWTASCDIGRAAESSPQQVEAVAMAVLSDYYCPIDAREPADASGGSITAHSPGGRAISISYAADPNGHTTTRVQVSGPKPDMCQEFARMLQTDIFYAPRWAIAKVGK
jgi:hypothetical protein